MLSENALLSIIAEWMDLSFRKIAAITGMSVDTVKSYLLACEEAYLLFSCPFFAFSEKKRLSRQKKYYPIDAIFINQTNAVEFL